MPFKVFDPNIKKEIVFRPVGIQDVDMLHRWMHQEHVIPFWKRNLSFTEYKRHLQEFLADDHQQLYIGSLDQTAMSYWETYWVKEDILGNYYDYDPADQGVHLLIGPPEFLGKGYATPLLQAITFLLFQQDQTQKVVAEPDVRNEKMIHVFEKCGYVFQREINLPDKRAALMFCERDQFIRSWEEYVSTDKT